MRTEVINVGQRYKDVEALVDVSLTVEDGEFVAILGPSGCGKTTLLRILAGFDTPTDGEVQMNGKTVGRRDFLLPTEKRHLGMVFQSLALWPHMSVADHVRFPLDHQLKIDRAHKDRRITEVLQITGLEGMRNRMPHELSGGQRQRVALARAIAPSPSLLLMDEPLSSLDATLRDEMRREIQNIHHATNASIIYVTHDQNEALAMANRVVVMREGRIEQIGTPSDIFLRPESDFVAQFVGKANLVAGTWHGDHFHPKAAPEGTLWDGSGLPIHFRETDLFPVRPEQFDLTTCEANGGISGVVANVLFQGSNVQYVITVGGETWRAHNPGAVRAEPGKRVMLQFVA